MSFARINYLFIIWTIPFLLLFFIYGMRRRRNILRGFADTRGLVAIVPQNILHRRWIKTVLILSAVLLIAVALAGPQYGYLWEEIEQQGVDLVIALDCSRSMLAEDIQPDRLERAKREIYDLLALLKGDRAGLVAFAGSAFLQCPLTLDHNAFYLFLNALTPDYLPVGGTDLEAAVNTAISAFDPKGNAEKAIILITDGEHTGKGDPIKAVQNAEDQHIKVFCIGVGGSEGVPLRKETGGFAKDSTGRIVLSKLDETMLKQMTEKGNGLYVRSVAGDMDLDAIYTKEIRGKMEAVTLQGGRRRVHQNRYQWPLFLAVLLLLAERCVSLVRYFSPTFLVLVAVTLALPASGRADEIQDGMKAYQNKEYSKAVDHFTAAQLENPEQPEILYNLGNTFYKMGEYDTARTHMLEALPKANDSLKAKIFYNLGNIDFRQGRMEDAIKNYQKALKVNPEDQQAKENIEFVKKVMAQKPPPSEDQKDQDQQKKDSEQKDSQQKKDGEQKDSQQQKSGESDKNNKDSGQDESKKDQAANQNDSNTDEKPPADRPKPMSGEMKSDDNKEASPSPAEKKPDDKTGKENQAAGNVEQQQPADPEGERAQRILNRLKDQPGKATMPAYGDTPVEKDW